MLPEDDRKRIEVEILEFLQYAGNLNGIGIPCDIIVTYISSRPISDITFDEEDVKRAIRFLKADEKISFCSLWVTLDLDEQPKRMITVSLSSKE